MTDQPRPADAAAKDTPAGGESTLSSDVLDLLAAIRDALTVPTPDLGTPDGYDKMRRLLAARAASVRLAAQVAVQMGTPGWGALAEGVRGGIERHPVDYPVWQDSEHKQADPAECAVCRRPFDPADTRFDGQARHRDTPYCRACVDRCHDTEIADHRCPICQDGAR